jgi:hypothetical protein
MPDMPENLLSIYRSAALAAIERGQEDAVQKLRLAGVPEQQILATVQQIEAACLTTLREQDAFYAELQALFRQPGRDTDHTRYIQERIAFYQQLMDTAVAEIVATAIRNAIKEFQQPPVREQPVIEVTPPTPGLPLWLEDLPHTATTLLINVAWLSGLLAGLFLSWVGAGSFLWSVFWSGVTVFVTALLWDWVGEHGWSVLLPLAAVGMFCWAFFL